MRWIIDYICRWLIKKYNKGQSTFCYCPNCGLELCNSLSWYAETDLMEFKCIKCGHLSGWLFDTPAPILVKGHVHKSTT